MRLLPLLAAVFILLLLPCLASATLILPYKDMTYLGAFRLPSSVSSYTMTFYPNGDPYGPSDGFPGSLFSTRNSVFVTNGKFVLEFTIPAPVISPTKNVNDLPTAQVLQGPADITGGRSYGGYTECTLNGLEYLPKQGSQGQDKLYWSRMTFYMNPCESKYYGWADLNVSNPNTAGMWNLSGFGGSVYAHYLFEIPKTWADAYVGGKYLVSGRYREGGGNSGGPSLFAIAPWEHGNPPADGTTLDKTSLLYYSLPNRVNNLSNNDWWWDGAWLEVGEKSAVILAGSKATRTKESGTGYYGGSLPDGCGESGYHSEPGYAAILFYNPDDLAAVAQGTKAPYEPQPYAMMQVENYLFGKIPSCNGGGQFGGVAYDRANNLLYIAEPQITSSETNSNIVHVFRIIDSGQPADTTPPTKPSSVSAVRTMNYINLTWGASTDDSGRVMYEVYRMGRPMGLFDMSLAYNYTTYAEDEYAPIAVTKNTYFTDTKYKYFIGPYEYKIEAHDVVNNVNSAEIVVPAAGMVIDISQFTDDGIGSVRHKIPDGIQGAEYSFQFQAIGGNSPYTWTSDFLIPGLTLNPSTGLLSGIPTTNGTYYSDVTVEDSSSPVPNIAAIYRLSMKVLVGNTSLSIVTASFPTGTSGLPYSQTLSASGGVTPYTWSITSGSLPPGLTLSASGTISGTPTAAGGYSFTVQAADSGGNTAMKSFVITIAAAGSGLCGKAFGNAWIEGSSAIIETSDGGYLAVGRTASWSNINSEIIANNVVFDIYVVKTDSNGNEIWHRVIGEGGFDIQQKQLGVTIHHRGAGVVETSDGYLILGYQAYGGNKVVVIKLDLNGNYVWNKSYYQGYSSGEGIVKTNDGNYFIVGYSGGTDIILLKVDPNGNQIWSKTYASSRLAYPNDVEKTTDGGLIIGGYSLGGSETNDGDFLLLKVDSNGNQQWYNYSYGVSGLGKNDRAWGVTQAYDGGYIIVGRTNSYDASGRTDYYILKTDANGNEQWHKISGSPKSHLLADIVKYGTNYIIAGYYHPEPQPYTGLIMAIDQSGNELWSKPVNNSEEIWSMKNTSDGRLVLTGTSLSFTTSYDLYLTKTDSSGNCLLTTSCTASGTYFYDKDLDSYGSYSEGSYLDKNVTASSMCIATTGYVKNDGECNDSNPNINPSVTENCNNGLDDNCNGLTDMQEPSCSTSGAKILYHFDKGPGESDTFVMDFSGNGNHASCTGTACPTWTSSGKLNGAFSYDGNDRFTATNPVASGSNMTLAMWVKCSPQTSYLAAGGFLLYLRSSAVDFYPGSGSWSGATSATVCNSSWRHVAIVHDSTTQNTKTYIDGSLASSKTTGTLSVASTFEIGSRGGVAFFTGDIDEVALFNMTLNQIQITELLRTHHKSDTDQDGCVSISELATFIGRWYANSSDPTIKELMEAIGLWKRGC